MSKIYYTIIYSNKAEHGRISWIGSTWRTEREAYEVGAKVCQELWGKMPELGFIVLAHYGLWETITKERAL